MKKIALKGLVALLVAVNLGLVERVTSKPKEVIEVQTSSRLVRIPPPRMGYGLAYKEHRYTLIFKDGSASDIISAENELTGEIPNGLIPRKGDKYLIGTLFGYNFGRE